MQCGCWIYANLQNVATASQGGVSKNHDNREGPATSQNRPLWKDPAAQPEEARYWLQQWREAAKPKDEAPIRKIVIRKNQNKVRE